MKYLYLLLFSGLILAVNPALSQCIPLDSIACPDPEKNGQICPDTVAPLFQGVDYSQEITFLAPARIDTLGISIEVDHLTLISIDGLPDGIDWVTNADLNEFYPEIYYCILFSGTTSVDTGTYSLSIVVDAYAQLFGQVIKVATLEDSTSLSIRVLNQPSFVASQQNLLNARVWPNPFTHTFNLEMDGVSGQVEVSLINILGETVFTTHINTFGAKIKRAFDGSFLNDGIYFVRLRSGDRQRSFLVSKR